MVATLVALAGAVVTVVFYVVTADRLDYATVQRRQLDLWVAVIGLGCLVTMLLGAADVRRDPTLPPTQVPRAPHASALVARLGGLREGRKSIIFVSQGPPTFFGADGNIEDAERYVPGCIGIEGCDVAETPSGLHLLDGATP